MDLKAALKDKWVLAVVVVGVLGILLTFGGTGELLGEFRQMSAEERQFAAMMGQSAMVLEMEKLERAAGVARFGALVSLAGLALVLIGRLGPGGWVLVAAGAIPALFHVNILLMTFLLIVAGGLALFAHKRRSAVTQPA